MRASDLESAARPGLRLVGQVAEATLSIFYYGLAVVHRAAQESHLRLTDAARRTPPRCHSGDLRG